MARKTKPGIPYFSHDTDILQDKKVKLLRAKHGLVGYAVYMRLLEETYRENGYYLHVDEDFNILFSDDNNLDLDVYILILNDCIKNKLFTLSLYEKHQILTSNRIQRNYFIATERRREVHFIKEYLLTDPEDFYNTEKVNVYIESLNVCNEALNEDIGTQSKVKYSKEDNSIKDIVDLDTDCIQDVSEPKTSEENTEAYFNSLWALYPVKRGKGQVPDAKKKLLQKIGYETLVVCLKRYTAYVEKENRAGRNLSFQNGSTFFTSGYVDYLDENFEEPAIQRTGQRHIMQTRETEDAEDLSMLGLNQEGEE